LFICADWWIKPQPDTSVPIAADGSFRFHNWASSGNDVNLVNAAIFIIPVTTPVANVLGGPKPTNAYYEYFSQTFPRGYAPGNQQASASPSTQVNNAPSIMLTAFPAAGTVTRIAGVVSGNGDPLQHKAVLYIQAPDGKWWIKPQTGSSSPIAADGSFAFNNWASSPQVRLHHLGQFAQLL
jgi:hypothetical protein